MEQKDNKTVRTIESYNKNAEKFESKFLNFRPYREKLSLFQQRYLGREKRAILDVGCGPGNNCRLLYDLNSNYQLTGIDLSEKMVELANINAPDCTFIKQDIRKLPMDVHYDAVIASFCIVHLSDDELEAFIPKIGRILNKDGYLYLSFIEGESSGFSIPDFSDDEIYFNCFERSAVIELLVGNGLKAKEVLEYDYPEENGDTSKEIFIFARKKG